MITVAGIDPGTKGAAVRLAVDPVTGERGAVECIRFSRSTWAEVARFLSGPTTFAVLEKVGAMPKQGVSSTFKFGHSAGLLEGVLLAHGVRHELVTPQTWQRALRLAGPKGESQPERKRRLKGEAQRRWPDRRIVAEDADAWLLAEYAHRLWVERYRQGGQRSNPRQGTTR